MIYTMGAVVGGPDVEQAVRAFKNLFATNESDRKEKT